MKKILFTLCVALLSMALCDGIKAQQPDDIVTFVKINKMDGAVHRYALPDKPVINFADDKIVVSAQELENLDIPRSEVSHIDFEKGKYSSIDAANLNSDDFTFGFVDNTTVMVASPRLTRVDLFDTAGHKLASVAAVGGNATVSLADFGAGVYIVVPDCHEAIKVVRK